MSSSRIDDGDDAAWQAPTGQLADDSQSIPLDQLYPDFTAADEVPDQAPASGTPDNHGRFGNVDALNNSGTSKNTDASKNAAPTAQPSTDADDRPAAPPTQPTVRPALAKDRSNAWVAGVAAGVARHLNWPIWLARICFIALTLTSFLGVAIYGALWALMPAQIDRAKAPGLVAADHDNMRSADIVKLNPARIVSVIILIFGVVTLAQASGLGVAETMFWPGVIASIGIALVWMQSDVISSRSQILAATPRWLRPFVAGRGFLTVLRLILGMGLMGLAVFIAGPTRYSFQSILYSLWVSGLTIGGMVVLAAPWLLSYQRRLNQAREEKLVADTRADFAAHLHDSVLQTLALIQRQAHDSAQVAILARRQERELRAWLYGDTENENTFKEALEQACNEVDAERGVPVELVCVGNTELTEKASAVVQAARESVMNAAKHSGSTTIDVYAEVEKEKNHTVQVFIRDRGCGFDMSQIAEDRMGVRRSIIERMERHGGTASIRSTPGEGTEIRLEMTL